MISKRLVVVGGRNIGATSQGSGHNGPLRNMAEPHGTPTGGHYDPKSTLSVVSALWLISFSPPPPSPNTRHFGGFEKSRIGVVWNVGAMGTSYGEIGTSGHIGVRPSEDYGRESARFPTASPISRFALVPSIFRHRITAFPAVSELSLLGRYQEKVLGGAGPRP